MMPLLPIDVKQKVLSIRSACFVVFALIAIFSVVSIAQVELNDRPIRNISIIFPTGGSNQADEEEFRSVAEQSVGDKYSVVRIRDSIEALHKTNKIVSVDVEASDTPSGVDLRYVIKRKSVAQKVSIDIQNANGEPVTEQELMFKLNLLDPGTPITEQTLQNNANVMLEYLRDRGYFNAEVTYTETPLQDGSGVGVVFHVRPNAQAKVTSFTINIKGANNEKMRSDIKLQPGEPYSRDKLNTDVETIRKDLRDQNFLAPELDEPRVVFDSEHNAMNITVEGSVGPTVTVKVDAGKESVKSTSSKEKLIPILSQGTLDYSAIVEGERRLENFYQEKGFFFADVTPKCSVTPPFNENEASAVTNNTTFLCSALGSADLTNRKVDVVYEASLNRRLNLAEIRLQGTTQFTIEDIRPTLESQESNILGFIPIFGYGHGLTSQRLLDQDTTTIKSLLRELGYRDAQVRVNQGVSPAGNDLIITFVVDEGPQTVVSDVSVSGNKEIDTSTLLNLVNDLVGKYHSRARVRNAQQKLASYYADQGYFDARVTTSETFAEEQNTDKKTVKVAFKVENEGKKVVINRVLVTGNIDTKPQAVLKAVTLKPNELLKRTDIYTSEQNLYSSDVFDRVDIKPQPAGAGPNGTRLSDVIVAVEEQAPRLIQYGGGYSTDLGANGFVDLRHFNLLGNLWQGGARIKWSQLQQLIQFDFISPRFMPDGDKRFAPLTLSASYQRDSTVTRFFRSAFDRGTFGIVQRVDENGNPIDEFGNRVGSPTINRLTFTAETNRTISRKQRAVLYVRYRFEDVRLLNIESLLIKDLLLPDSRVRISGFGATFVRDTRERCSIKYSILETIARGEPADRCRYDAADPTGGDYLTAEYNVSAPALGANIGFQKFQLSYNYYYSFPRLRNATIAARGILGLANVFARGDRFSSAQFPGLEGVLPISERFFAGGAYTLRGFNFEEAGPRVAILPQGIFRNTKGEPVRLDPFTVPFGGNALAVINIEGRIPLSDSVRAVPFYDGGNVFRRVGDLFNPPNAPANDAFTANLRAVWSHTVGLGLRIKTPIGGEFGIDYGFLLNPPRFLIPQASGPDAIYQLRNQQLHFRFSQAF
ncbi:MAG TPA: POTRA domain-containing protein [Pyrinomonadaceae bacterium]|nr:POTRA domain-containing protein [Pyrinomonadaceae bacterium]